MSKEAPNTESKLAVAKRELGLGLKIGFGGLFLAFGGYYLGDGIGHTLSMIGIMMGILGGVIYSFGFFMLLKATRGKPEE